MPFRLNELGGETGEACNLLKKLDREERLQITGSRTTNDDLADEIADVAICLDLCALHIGLDARRITNKAETLVLQEAEFEASLSTLGNVLFVRVGRFIDKADLGGSADTTVQELEARAAMAWASLLVIAIRRGFNLDMAIANKFNMTSRKIGLQTTLMADE